MNTTKHDKAFSNFYFFFALIFLLPAITIGSTDFHTYSNLKQIFLLISILAATARVGEYLYNMMFKSYSEYNNCLYVLYGISIWTFVFTAFFK